MALLPFIVLPLLLVIAAWYDVTSYTIPNWISGLLLVSYFLLAPLLGLAWIDIGLAALTSFAFLLIGMFMFAMRWLGGGDAKLLMATALWFGWPMAWTFAVVVMVFGGLVVMALVTFRKLALPEPVQQVPWVVKLHEPGGDVPYGTAIALGGLVLLGDVPLMAGLF